MKSLIESLQLEIALLESACDLYMGDMCDIPVCFNVSSSSPLTCSGRGNCTDIDTCLCHEGYNGVNCSKVLCFGVSSDQNNTCSGQGHCIEKNTCQCLEGFTGINCQVILPPVMESRTHNSITLNPNVHMEFNMNDEPWQISNVFSNLNHSFVYSFRQRKIDNHSLVSEPVEFTLMKDNQETPSAPLLLSRTSTSITLEANSAMEFRIDNGEWQDSNIFTNLLPGTLYSFSRRYAESISHYSSPPSPFITFSTDKEHQETPSPPAVASISSNSITLEANSNMEFRRENGEWQDSNIFSGLHSMTTYTFTRRFRETTTHHASDESLPANFTTSITAPALASRTATSITLTHETSMIYSRDNGAWVSSNIFSGLVAGNSYTFRRKLNETLIQRPSQPSASITYWTLSNWREWHILSGQTPNNRNGHTSVIYNNSMVAFGGQSSSNTLLSDIWEYDISNNRWSQKIPIASIPARHRHSSVIVNDVMYILGGMGSGNSILSSLFGYNFTSNQWTTLRSLPTSRCDNSLVVYNNSMYVFGGWDGNNPVGNRNDLRVYDISSNEWNQLHPTGNLPSARHGHRAVVYNDKMYVFGGWADDYKKDIWEYDFLNNHWTEISIASSTSPDGRFTHSIVISNNRMFIFGGFGNYRRNDLWEFNLSNKRWTQLIPSNTILARDRHTAVIHNQRMFIFAGHTGSIVNEIWEYPLPIYNE